MNNGMFSKCLCIWFIKRLMINVRKTLQMNLIMTQSINNRDRGQIQYLLRLLINENIIFMSEIARYWLRHCDTIQLLLLGIACGAIFDKVLSNLLLLLTSIFV